MPGRRPRRHADRFQDSSDPQNAAFTFLIGLPVVSKLGAAQLGGKLYLALGSLLEDVLGAEHSLQTAPFPVRVSWTSACGTRGGDCSREAILPRTWGRRRSFFVGRCPQTSAQRCMRVGSHGMWVESCNTGTWPKDQRLPVGLHGSARISLWTTVAKAP